MSGSTIAWDLIAHDNASPVFKKIGDSVDHTSGRMDKWKNAAKLGAAAVSVALVKFGKDSVGAYVEAQAAQEKLQFAFDKFPGLADTNIGAVRKLNTEWAKKTKFDDDAIASGQAVLAQFKLTGKQLTDTTPLLLDYAAKTGKDLPDAAGAFGKALLGNTRSLKLLGIDYKSTGDRTQDYANITQLMRDKVGGFATKEGKSAAGQAEILKNQFGEVEETVGQKLVPVLTTMAGILLKVIDFVQRNSAVLVPLVAVIGGVAAVVMTVVQVQKAWIAVQTALNFVMSANPIGLVIIAVALLVGGIVLAYKHSETFRTIVQTAFGAVATAGGAMWDVLRPVFKFVVDSFLNLAGAIVHGAANAFGWVPGIGGKLKDAANKFDDFRDSVNASLSGIQDRDVRVTAHVDALRTASGRGVTKNATGTRNFAGGLSWVGEQGPELVSLPRGTDVFSNGESMAMTAPRSEGGSAGSTGDTYLQVTGVIDDAMVRKLRAMLDDLARQRGSALLAPAR